MWIDFRPGLVTLVRDALVQPGELWIDFRPGLVTLR